MNRWLMGMIAVLLGLASSTMADAQDYPTRPITMIVPFPAGARPIRWRDFWPSRCGPFSANP